ncbi:MAG: bifunctional folylpolyglutamate synthase/dihydrofolate synthase, partial [Chitinophagaceae bacterium]|nr:bifunctional folylpolyglutamate synthase/dihydrofolate synthase [Chitinophagaceae bacterium]
YTITNLHFLNQLMDYSQTLNYLYTKLPMFSRIGAAAIKPDLTNTIALSEALGDPHKKFKSIHIAGTNGKGSCSHMLAAVFQSAGYKTGLHTSPHLKDFRERIKVNGAMCPEEFVVDFVQRTQKITTEIEPSFFELTVAMAFDYFAKEKVDIAIIETGLGGRLDSTNIIQPEISFITNIGLDHMNLLGDSLEKIAYEKAGIIKPGTAVVIGEVIKETKPVFEKAATEKEAPLIFAEEERFINEWTYTHQHLQVILADNKGHADTYECDLPGIYQLKNIRGVTEVLHQLKRQGWKIEHQHIAEGLKNVKRLTGLHGRWEKVKDNPTVILDVAHNVDGIKELASQLEHCTYNDLHIIIGMVKDKEVDSVLKLLPLTANYYFTQSNIARALPVKDLSEKASQAGLHGKSFNNVNDALKEVIDHSHKDDLVLICGSVFLVGEVIL